MLKIFYIQPILTNYREPIVEALSRNHNLTVAFSPILENSGFKQGKTEKVNVINTKIYNLWNNKILFQNNIHYHIIYQRPDVVLACASTRDISYWLTLILCNILNIKIYSHGQGLYSKKNPGKFTKLIYRAITKLSTKYICYTEISKKTMVSAGCNTKKIVVADNSIKFPFTAKHIEKTGQESGILYIGRLRENCNLEVLIDAFLKLKNIDKSLKLHIIGEGELDNYYKNKFTDESIFFYGAIYDHQRILNISKDCRFGCYPGDAGLSIVHYFSLKLPPIVHNEITSHMGPEPSYISNDINGFTFDKKNGYTGLYDKLKELFSMPTSRYVDISKNAFETYIQLNTPPLEEKILSIIENGHIPKKDLYEL